MKMMTKTAMLLAMLLLATPMLADELTLGDEAAPQQEAVFGSDLFDDIRLAINHQAGTEFTIYAHDLIVDTESDDASEFRGEVGWWGGAAASWRQMADEEATTSESFYVNDSWQMDDSWSFEADANAAQATDDK